jgi:hypothetical protein
MKRDPLDAGAQHDHQIVQGDLARRIAEPDIQIEYGDGCAMEIEQPLDHGRTMRQRHRANGVDDAFDILKGKTECAAPRFEQQDFARHPRHETPSGCEGSNVPPFSAC